MAFRKMQLIRFIQNVKSSSTFTKHSYTATTPPIRGPTELRTTKQISLSAAPFPADRPPMHFPFSAGEDLMNTIRSSMRRPDMNAREEPGRTIEESVGITLSVEDTRKLLEAARRKLKEVPMGGVPYSDFVQIPDEIGVGDDDAARKIAFALEDSGNVVVLGNVVFLRPEQVAREIEAATIPRPISDSRRRELKEMEAVKAVIEGKAEMGVRREMWAGLGLLFLQTTGFFRLTFWEFSWDVMEPICFFSTSLYFIMGWAFFMRTAREPTFEGFFAGRVASKRRKLMKAHGFDLTRLKELREETISQS